MYTVQLRYLHLKLHSTCYGLDPIVIIVSYSYQLLYNQIKTTVAFFSRWDPLGSNRLLNLLCAFLGIFKKKIGPNPFKCLIYPILDVFKNVCLSVCMTSKTLIWIKVFNFVNISVVFQQISIIFGMQVQIMVVHLLLWWF